MNTLIAAVLQVLRKSRGPLTAGSLIVVAIWIQLADQLSGEWPGRFFGRQVADILTSLQGFGLATVLLLIVGIAGSASTRASRLLLEPGMRFAVERWQERCAVRKYKRSQRWSNLEIGGSEYEIVDAHVTHDRQFIKKAIRWLLDWIPSKATYVEYHMVNFWLEPKWGRRAIGWATQEVYDAVPSRRRTVSFESLRTRLAQDSELRNLVMSLEKELEGNPLAPFVSEDCTTEREHLNAIIGENEYRLAVMPALTAVLVSIGLVWWPWSFAFVPITLLVYGSSLAKHDDVPRSALGWLLDGKGSFYALDEIRHWAEREAEMLNT